MTELAKSGKVIRFDVYEFDFHTRRVAHIPMHRGVRLRDVENRRAFSAGR